MALEKRTDRNRNAQKQRASPSPASASKGGRAEREREITPQREDRGSPGTELGRPYSAQIREPGHDSLSVMRRIAEDMDRLFQAFGVSRPDPGLSRRSLLDGAAWGGAALAESLWSPQIETFRKGDNLVVRADLPGLKKEDINIDVAEGILTLSGERKHENEEERDGDWRSERSYGQFVRAIPLPEGVKESDIDASFRDGVLEIDIRVPQQPERQSRRIKVR